MKIKLVTAVVSTFVFAILYSWNAYIPHTEQEPDTYYFGFWETAIFVTLYVGPIYLVAGIPLSYAGDVILRRFTIIRDWVKFIVGLVVYGSLGAFTSFIMIPLLLTVPTFHEVIYFSMIGVVAANLFYMIQLIFIKQFSTPSEIHSYK